MAVKIAERTKYPGHRAEFVINKLIPLVESGLLRREYENNQYLCGKFIGTGKCGVRTNFNVRVYLNTRNESSFVSTDYDLLEALVNGGYPKDRPGINR